MTSNFNKLKELLKQLFQLDRADLDFGIYRIINQERQKIDRFLDEDLLPQVKAVLGKYQSSDRIILQNDLEEAIEQVANLEYHPDTAAKVKEIRQEFNKTTDVRALEEEVYSHLYNFFRRYYHEGEFLPLRRYKQGVYAIPYQGEEVKLHWANANQYYIKSSQSLRNYKFKLPSGRRVKFEVVTATTERDNNKANKGKERRFYLSDDRPVNIEENELILRFEYSFNQQKQNALNLAACETIFELKELESWKNELTLVQPTEKNPERTVLQKHLANFTAKNTFDYFIHKDLGNFLRQELDFFIKSEVMHLDDIESDSALRVEQSLALIRAFRQVAHKIIAFLEQIENFKKKLWLKKKFVIETNYCITLDRVPKELYPEVIANVEQVAEWKRLFAIAEISCGLEAHGYSEPLTIDFLEFNSFLVLDTKFFSQEFKNRLLDSIENLDEQIDGLLIHSENSQALNLLREKYREAISSIYIDPPYNTERDRHRQEGKFLYKDSYKHSSWLSMMQDRVGIATSLLSQGGTFSISIDDSELHLLRSLIEENYPKLDYLNTVSVQTKPAAGASGGGGDKRLKKNAEYLLVFAKSIQDFSGMFHLTEQTELFELIESMKEEGKSWKYTSVLLHKGDLVKQKILLDGEGNEIKVSLFDGVIRTTISELAREKYDGDLRKAYLDNFNCIFSDTNAQTSIRTRIIDEFRTLKTNQLLEATYIPKSGKNKGQVVSHLYISPSIRRVIWLADSASLKQGKILKKERLGTLWSGLNWNNVSKEGDTIFQNGKKPIGLVSKCITFTNIDNALTLDFFAGSGTTAHAAISLNREDGGRRKYILVEMGDYFDSILKPRIQKVIYSKDWRNRKPVSRQGSSHLFKYIHLESYEDTLNNLEIKPLAEPQQVALEQYQSFRESYILSYMLDFDTPASASLLKIEAFDKPFNYKLKIWKSDGYKIVTVDLVETFNYLIGLSVHRIQHIQGVRAVQGINRKNQRVLVLWRDLEQMDNDALDRWFIEQGYNSDDLTFDLIYVNYDNNLANLKAASATWQVLLIEAEFHRLMFDIQDI